MIALVTLEWGILVYLRVAGFSASLPKTTTIEIRGHRLLLDRLAQVISYEAVDGIAFGQSRRHAGS